MSIPSGLIIYSPKRYYVNVRVSTKHGLSTRKLFFKKKVGMRKNKEFQCAKVNYRQIRDLNYTFYSTKREKSMFLKFTSRLLMLRKLCLSFETSSSGAKHNISFLRKLFAQNKRISNITVILCKRGKDNTFVLSPLSLAKCMKHIELRLQFHSESMIERLAQFLGYMYRRNNWPSLKCQTVSLDIGFTGLSLDNDVMNVSQTLINLGKVTSQKPTNLHLLFYFRRSPNIPALETLSDALRHLDDIIALSLISQVNTDFSCLLKSIQDSKRLKDVTTYICNDQQTSQTLMVLPESLGNIKTLTNLKLHFLDMGDIEQFNYFAERLCMFTQLTALALTFFRTGLLNDKSLDLLGASLAKLTNLRDLHINCKKQTRNSQISSPGIESVFATIANLTKLKSLTLNFSGYGSSIAEKTVEPLFTSLGFLTNLQYLSLNLSLNRIGDDGINCLRRVIPNLKKMKSLILEFEQCVWLSSKALSKFAISLKQLKNLSFLTLKFMSAMVDVPLALTLASVLSSLRSLRALEVRLYRWNDSYDDGLSTLLESVKHLEGRVRLDFKCPLFVLLPRIL